MKVAAGKRRRSGQHAGHRGISPLQRREAQLGVGVGVLQRVYQLAERPLIGIPVRQQSGHGLGFPAVIRRLRRAVRSGTDEIVGQGEPMTGGDRQHLVHAVGIEGGEGNLRRISGAQVEPDLAPLVPHQQFAAGGQGGQHDHQRGEHAGLLLGISVPEKEIPLAIKQQLVELGGHGAGDAKPLRRTLHDPVERLRLVPAGNMHPGGVDLPRPADRGVEQGLRSAPEECTRRGGDQLLRLHGQQRQGDRSNPIHFDQGASSSAVPEATKSPGRCTAASRIANSAGSEVMMRALRGIGSGSHYAENCSPVATPPSGIQQRQPRTEEMEPAAHTAVGPPLPLGD
ncbi:hypothetical protein [Azospirillum endophyticum]